MRYLIDAHTLLWRQDDISKLPALATSALSVHGPTLETDSLCEPKRGISVRAADSNDPLLDRWSLRHPGCRMDHGDN